MSTDASGGTSIVRVLDRRTFFAGSSKASPEHPIRAFMKAHEIGPIVRRTEGARNLPELVRSISSDIITPKGRLRDTLLILDTLIMFGELGVQTVGLSDRDLDTRQLCGLLFKPEMRPEISLKEAFGIAKAVLGSEVEALNVALPHLDADGKELAELIPMLGPDGIAHLGKLAKQGAHFSSRSAGGCEGST